MEKGSSRSDRARTRSVHFQDIEGDSEARLTLFEKDILNKIRSSKDSPREELIKKDEISQSSQLLRRLNRYAKYAELTPKQWKAYKLFLLTEGRMTFQELARKLKISPSSAWARVHGAASNLEKVQLQRKEGDKLKKVLDGVLYAGKLRKVFRLYFERGWPPRMVAKSTHSKLSTIYDNIQTIRILGYIHSCKQYIRWQEARKKISASVEKTSNKKAKLDQI